MAPLSGLVPTTFINNTKQREEPKSSEHRLYLPVAANMTHELSRISKEYERDTFIFTDTVPTRLLLGKLLLFRILCQLPTERIKVSTTMSPWSVSLIWNDGRLLESIRVRIPLLLWLAPTLPPSRCTLSGSCDTPLNNRGLHSAVPRTLYHQETMAGSLRVCALSFFEPSLPS